LKKSSQPNQESDPRILVIVGVERACGPVPASSGEAVDRAGAVAAGVLLQAFHGIRSQRQLMERMEVDLLRASS
jgi:hypothetical protein